MSQRESDAAPEAGLDAGLDAALAAAPDAAPAAAPHAAPDAAPDAAPAAPAAALEKAPAKQGFRFGIRHLVCFMLFLALTVAYALRVDMSVGIVAMTDPDKNPDYETFNWDSGTRSTILSSFFWGYVITQVPGGQMAERFGPQYLLVGALAISGVLTLFTPLAAGGGWGWVCATRVIQGLGQGLIYPSVHNLLSKWAPVEERSRLVTYVYAGVPVGTIVGMPISGLLAESAGGWPSIFYFFGALGLLWVLLWLLIGANSPKEHRWCSEKERNLIVSSLGSASSQKRLPTPWKALFTSPPMLALIICHMGQNWGFWTLLTNIPTFLDSVMEDMEIKESATLSALPYLAMWILSFFFGYMGDVCITRKWLTIGNTRKLFNSIAHWIPAGALIGLGYVDPSNKWLAMGVLTVAVGLNSATYCGYQVNHIDLSPNFAGTMMGITNGAANVMSIIGPLMVGVIVPEDELDNVAKWRIVFYISAAFFFVGNLIFVIFGSGEVQPWNAPPEDHKDLERNAEKAPKEDLEEKPLETKK